MREFDSPSYDADVEREHGFPAGAEMLHRDAWVSLQSGGHLLLGQDETVRTELAAFLAERRD